MASLSLADFDFHLPAERIAQTPAPRRDESRLLVLDRKTGSREHRVFRELADYLRPGDLLVLNDTKVIPARLFGTRPSGARIEVLLIEELSCDRWQALVRPGRKAQEGTEIAFAPGFRGQISAVLPDGSREILMRTAAGTVREAIATHGALPLPPYIAARPEDTERYQTVFAKEEGAIAAPTAGLHFTPAMLDSLRERGIETAALTLHVGLGTFKPVTVEDVRTHVMHAERYRVPMETVEQVRRAKARGSRVVAVGTTAVRTLEHAAASGELLPGSGETRLFIYPGYRFRVVDAMVTNFHLPKSTLLMLVAAFLDQEPPQGRTGQELLLEAYEEAIAMSYRFYSFGDAMFLHG